MYNYVNVLFSIELCIYKNKKKKKKKIFFFFFFFFYFFFLKKKKKKKKKVSFHVPFGIILFII